MKCIAELDGAEVDPDLEADLEAEGEADAEGHYCYKGPKGHSARSG